MKAMVQFTSNEVNRLQYQVVVEMWKRIKEGSKRRLYEATFDEIEREKISRWYTVFSKWYVETGVPATGAVMSPHDLLWLQNKVIPFFAQLYTTETLHERRVDLLTRVHAMLIGKRFADLREDELRILYAWELWGDGMDLDQIFTEMTWNETNENKIPLAEIHQQLKDVFGYNHDDLIKED